MFKQKVLATLTAVLVSWPAMAADGHLYVQPGTPAADGKPAQVEIYQGTTAITDRQFFQLLADAGAAPLLVQKARAMIADKAAWSSATVIAGLSILLAATGLAILLVPASTSGTTFISPSAFAPVGAVSLGLGVAGGIAAFFLWPRAADTAQADHLARFYTDDEARVAVYEYNLKLDAQKP